MKYLKNGYLAAILYMLPVLCQAADIASEVREGAYQQTQDGGYFELGLVAGYISWPWRLEQDELWRGDKAVLDFDGAGEYRKNGFFAEAAQGTQDGLNLGYTLWQNNYWTVELLAGSLNGLYEPDYDISITPADDEATRNDKLYKRNTFYQGTGIRLSHYVGDYVVQYRLLTDTFDNNGVMSTLRIGRGWQYRNWSFHGIVSAEYASAKTNNYWFGVKEDEATEKYPVYSSNSGISYNLRLGAAKPINEKWVFRAYTGYILFSEGARDSSFVENTPGSFVVFTVNRVFNFGQ